MRARGSDRVATTTLLCVASLSLMNAGASMPLADGQEGDPVRRVRQAVPGTYLVALRRDDNPDAVAGESALVLHGRVRHIYRATRGFAIRLPHAAARVLAHDPRAASAEEGRLEHAARVQRRHRSSARGGLDR